jgi:hypothetical protein
VTLSVTLRADNGTGRGLLEGHPARVAVRSRRTPDGRLSVSLWDGNCQIGSGLLRAERGFWRGETSEFAGRWFVSGRIGSGILEFSEAPE